MGGPVRKLKLWDGRRWVTMSEDDDSAGLWIRVLGVTAATVRGSIVRWQPVSAEYPFAEFYTNITRGSNRLSGSAMSAARVHNRPLSLVDDAIRGIDYSRIPSGYRFSGKCLVVYRLMWDITGGASGAAGAGVVRRVRRTRRVRPVNRREHRRSQPWGSGFITAGRCPCSMLLYRPG